jgi:GH15 family glucan-1,4-alpha-glucosidase
MSARFTPSRCEARSSSRNEPGGRAAVPPPSARPTSAERNSHGHRYFGVRQENDLRRPDYLRARASEMVVDEPLIGDHALLGDTRTAALVSGHGQINWMCVPRFDCYPIFGRLVDPERGGTFSISLAGAERHQRSYLDDSAVLETTTYTSTGVARVTEGMIANVSDALLPQTLLVRRVECISGHLELSLTFDPRLGLPGRAPDRVRRMHSHGALICEWGSMAVVLQSDPYSTVEPGVGSIVKLEDGQVATFTMSIADRCPVSLITASRANELLVATDRWWHEWSKEIQYQGPHRQAVVRSLLTLRMLTYSPSGAPVAAPTTSLPEAVGGSRNWDYRYAWPRDAAMGLAAFLAGGDTEMAHSFMHWLLHASRLTRPRIRVLYDIMGKPAPQEEDIKDVAGYRASLPVRVGNAADQQHQLDVYGWVIDAASLLEGSGHKLHGETWRAVAGFADLVAKIWREPDAGIWEVRDKPDHFVHSKLMAWLALDRAARMAKSHRVKRGRRATWLHERDAIADDVREKGVDRERQTFVRCYGDHAVDASLLLLPVLEFEPPGSPLIRGTIRAVREDLEVEPGLLYRYRPGAEGLEGIEGAFLPCSFWLVQALARAGEVKEATDVFDRVLSYSNDVGLWSEEIDPESKAALGNFPQAFTHAALAQAARALVDAPRKGAA